MTILSLQNQYTINGYRGKEEYLNFLRDQYGVDPVNALISVLPESEYMDGLVTELEDNWYLFQEY